MSYLGNTLIPLYDNSACFIATVNPFRYRSYYYDTETQLYYLQSRYYDPVVGRFINGDEAIFVEIDNSVLACNIFAYCKNSPCMSIDAFGYDAGVITQSANEMIPILTAAVPALSAAAKSILISLKSVIAALWNVFVVVGLIVLVILLILAIANTASKVMEFVAQTIANYDKNSERNGFVVYVLTRVKEDPSKIFYVGRIKNFNKRMKQHEKTKGKFVGYVVVRCKNEISARATEQAVLSACIATKLFAIDKHSTTGSNKRREIARDDVRGFKNGKLNDLIGLVKSPVEDEILNMMEKY